MITKTIPEKAKHFHPFRSTNSRAYVTRRRAEKYRVRQIELDVTPTRATAVTVVVFVAVAARIQRILNCVCIVRRIVGNDFFLASNLISFLCAGKLRPIIMHEVTIEIGFML